MGAAAPLRLRGARLAPGGDRCAETSEDKRTAWETVAAGLGMARASEGDVVETAVGASRVRGVVESAEEDGIVVRTEEPAPGLMEVFAFDFKGPTLIFVRGYLYGDAGSAAVEREEPVWRTWLAERLPGADAAAQHPVRSG